MSEKEKETDGPNWAVTAIGAGMVLFPEPATTTTGVAVMGYGLLPRESEGDN